ncbi:MAG: bifunctional tetrahydrofolate synthase/dihydrofolate synthase [Betaproteobacteria bacterium]|nr:bifunctional tetrahydrofolate synthase/dihydrofolate synthase [Betaproteobacteria bacterium]
MTLPRTLDDWLDHISRQHHAEIVMGLERVRAVWQRMGSPQAPLNITVGGTNGKGSTCAMLESILHVAGYRTGFYTSPHLLRYNERVRLNTAEADDELLMASFAAAEQARVSPEPVPLTYFEFGTLSALWIFAEKKVEVGILEVGLGGRLDAVNIVDADAAVIASVDLDHQNFLGDTREKIGWEKAHIYRPGRPAIFADRDAPASLVAHAGEIGAQLILLGRNYRFTRSELQWQLTGTLQGLDFSRSSLPFPALRGDYQLRNAAAALVALVSLAERIPVSLGHIKRGLLEVEWPGRMQVLPGLPTVVLDVAHNPHAVRALHDALGNMGFFQNTYAVFGMMKDKDIDAVIAIIQDRIDHWFVAGLPVERGASAALIAEKLAARGLQGRFSLHSSIAQAYAAARERAGQNDRILTFGSFHTVADVLNQLKPS